MAELHDTLTAPAGVEEDFLPINGTDYVEFYQVTVQALFFLTPIMYPEEILPDWAVPLMYINPLYRLVQMFRYPVYYGQFPDLETVLWASATSVAYLAVGWVAFTRRADELPYRI